MKKNILLLIFTSFYFISIAQLNDVSCKKPRMKIQIFTQKTGLLLGLQQGKFTNIEVGLEHQWKKLKLVKPHVYAAKANMEYNFEDNVIGYKVGAWTRQGRLALTYGANFSYFTDFENSNIGITPAIGIKLIGFHFENGYNFVLGPQNVENINFIYVSARYFFINNRRTKIKRKKRK